MTLGLLLVILAAGCEERVVGIRNDWSGDQGSRLNIPQSNRPEPPGFFDNLGKTLFGWTSVFSGGDAKPAPAPRQPQQFFDPNNSDRMSQPTTKTGGGQ